jgi:hypothetical protein
LRQSNGTAQQELAMCQRGKQTCASSDVRGWLEVGELTGLCDKHFDTNNELAAIIKTCIRKTGKTQLETLKGLLNQCALQRPDLEHKHPDFQGNED